MATVWGSGTLRAVYVYVKKNADGSRRMRRANFDILRWDSNGDGIEETYVNFGGTPIGSRTDFNDTGKAEELGQMFGFYEDGYDVVEPHGWHYPDTVLALHCGGYY